jgi:hypothetical protein
VDFGESSEVTLGHGLSLLRTNPQLLNARNSFDLNKRQFSEIGDCSWFLVHRGAGSPARDAKWDKTLETLQSALMALQIVKPIETYGFVFQGYELTADRVEWVRTNARAPMSAGQWAHMRAFDEGLLACARSLVEPVLRTAAGSDIPKKNALSFLQLSLEHPHHYVACLLAVAGMEAIFDSRNRQDFEAKLCGRLGGDSHVFPDWNSPAFEQLPYKLQDIAVHLYTLWSKIAHGVDLTKAADDKNFPVDLLELKEYVPESDPVRYAALLCESSIYLLCRVLHDELTALRLDQKSDSTLGRALR